MIVLIKAPFLGGFSLYKVELIIFNCMVCITSGQNGYIYLSLRDKRLTNSDTYSFNFVNEVTNESININLSDISNFKDRYSKFAILDVTFNSKPIGFWRYYVTQTASGSNIIATGKMELTADNLSDTQVTRYNGYVGSYKTYTL